MKFKHIIFAISIATLTACGSSNNDSHSHEKESHEHNHNHAHDHSSHNHASHNHTNCNHNHGAKSHDSHNSAINASHNHDEHAENSDEIVFSNEKAKHFGIKTEKVTYSTFNDIIKVSGEVLPSQIDESVISAKSSGIIKLNTNAIVGKHVNEGTSVASISSQTVSGGDANEAARINFEAAKRELERITPLYNDKIITEREYNQAKQTYDQAKAALASNSGVGSSASSNISGTITQVLVKDGEYVEIGTPIAVVSKNTRLILRADLPNRYANAVAGIKSANFRPAYSETVYELSKLNGKIVSNKNLSITTPGYIPVNFEFSNSAGIIPGTYAEVYLIGATKNKCITLPIYAITEEEGYHFVYAKIHNEAYMKKEVKLGMNNGNKVEIISGIKEGDEIVTQGAILIKLASQANSVPGHSHDH